MMLLGLGKERRIIVTWSHFLQRLLCTGEVSFSLPRAPQFLTHSTGLLNIFWVNESVWARFLQEGLGIVESEMGLTGRTLAEQKIVLVFIVELPCAMNQLRGKVIYKVRSTWPKSPFFLRKSACVWTLQGDLP